MNTNNNDKNVYKDNVFRTEIQSDIERNMQKFNDPLVLGELLYKLLEERENTNRILKNLLVKLEQLEQKLVTGHQDTEHKAQSVLLPEIDEDIIAFVKSQGKASAEDVRQKFNYRGTNAACARLN